MALATGCSRHARPPRHRGRGADGRPRPRPRRPDPRRQPRPAPVDPVPTEPAPVELVGGAWAGLLGRLLRRACSRRACSAEPAPAVPAPIPQPSETARTTGPRAKPTPAADRADPPSGPQAGYRDHAGGTRVTVTGARFSGAVEVLFDGVAGTRPRRHLRHRAVGDDPALRRGQRQRPGHHDHGAQPRNSPVDFRFVRAPSSTGSRRPPARRRGNPLSRSRAPTWMAPAG